MRSGLGCTSALALALWTLPAEAKLAELLVTDADVKKPIELAAATVDATVDLTSARISYDLVFVNGKGRAQEGTFYFALPRNAYVHEFGMWINGKYQGSAITEAKAGRIAYESIVRRGVDPGLLEWTAGNTFKMRVFPVFPGKETRIRLIVAMPATAAADGLRLKFPLDLGKVEAFDLKVHGEAFADDAPAIEGLKGLKLRELGTSGGVVKFSGQYKAKAYLPPDAITIAIKEEDPEDVKVRREDGDDARFFELHAFPKLAAATRPAAERAVIFWDYSLSGEEAKAERLVALRAYLAARKPATVDVYGFSQSAFVVGEGLKPDAVFRAVTARAYDGGTRLDVAAVKMKSVLAKLAAKSADFVLFTDGVDSFELFDFKNVKGFAAKTLQAFVIAPGVGANDALLQRFAGALDAVILDQDDDLPATAFTTRPWALSAVRTSKNVTAVETKDGANFFPKNGVFLRGQLKKDDKAEVVLVFKQGGKTHEKTYKFSPEDIDRGKSETVARLWANDRITRLLAERRKNAVEIKRLALNHQLMSPYTVRVVLEACEDYAEFKLNAPKGCEHRTFEDFAEADDATESDEDGAANAAGPAGIDFDTTDISSRRKTPTGDVFTEGSAASSDAAPADKDARPPRMEVSEASLDSSSDDLADAINALDRAEEAPADTPERPYGFEALLAEKAKSGVEQLYAQYLVTRPHFAKIPFYYIHAASLFQSLKRPDLADTVLSNVVEIRPGDARWLRIYAYSLVAWGRAIDTIAIYRAVAELRGEDPQSFRDFGLAMEAIGQPVGAMRLFEKVLNGKWDSRLEGMHRTIVADLARAANKSLKTAGLSAENRQMAQRYAGIDESKRDKLVVTASWDTDNTDVDLHVSEPGGTHVFFNNKEPPNSAGRLNWDSTKGFGPEQYRNAAPLRGHYRVFLTYYSQNLNALSDGSFVRLDFKIVEKGVERAFTKTLFLKDQDETRTVYEFDYNDPSAPLPPPDFKSGIAAAKAQLGAKRYADALATLGKLGKRADPRDEAQRYFLTARGQLGLKRFDAAEQSNQRALALDPTLVAAHFNNACARSLARDPKKALFYLNLLADSLQTQPEKRAYFLRVMGSDPDLAGVRGNREFPAILDRLRTGH